MADESIPGFTVEPELEDLLDEHPLDLDEETRERVQLYKSRKLQAKRDAGLSGKVPSWTVRYPGERPGETSGNGTASSEPETASPPEETPDRAEGERETPPGRAGDVDPSEDGDDALMEYYRSVKSGSGRPRQTSGEGGGGDADSAGTNVSADAVRALGDGGETADVLALVRDWVSSLEDRLEEYHRKIVALEEENADLREELERRRD